MDVLDSLVSAAAENGLEYGDLRLSRTSDGYRFETPARSESGLSEDELLQVAVADPFVHDWYHWEHVIEGHGTAHRAFLRWLEGADDVPADDRYVELADGVTRHWGQLAITIDLHELEDGVDERLYEVRHEDDLGRTVDETYTDPLDARRLVKHDDAGRYRPLSTVPSLPHDWAFVDLDGDALVRTVDFIYPATIANWYREREGALDIDHWDAVASRQSGIYAIVDHLEGDSLEWAVEACCVDSQCLKRREWQASADDELGVPGGDGVFPCREACSLFVTAARKFVTLEREDAREYTFELTPTEKEQIESIIGAVADETTGTIREADLNEGANRYRTRYLRAKRMTSRGLSDTPTYPEDHE